MQACPAALYYMYKIIEHCKYGDLFFNSKEIGQEKCLVIHFIMTKHFRKNDRAF